MKLGTSSLALPLFEADAKPIDEVLDVVFGEGLYQTLEVHVPDRERTQPTDPHRLVPDSVRAVTEVARKARQRGAEILLGLGARFLLGPQKHEPSLIHPEPEGRELRLRLIEEAIDLAADLDARMLIFLCGPTPNAAVPTAQKTRLPEWDRLEASFDRLLQKAEARGVILAPEGHSAHMLASIGDLAALKRRFPTPFLGFTGDTLHQTLVEQRPLDEVYQQAAPWATHVQMDNTTLTAYEPGMLIPKRLLFEEGSVDQGKAIAGLHAGGYQGAVSVEFLRQDLPHVDPLQYCKDVGHWLRQQYGPLLEPIQSA